MEAEQVKKESFWKQLQKSKWKQVCFFVGCMAMLVGIFVVVNRTVDEWSSRNYIITEDKNVIKYIEEVNTQGEEVVISGWCFYNGVDSKKDEIRIFIKNVENENDVIWFDIENVVREDVDQYYDSDIDYSQSGFVARAKISKSKINSNAYEIFIKIDYEKEQMEKNFGTEEFVETQYEKTVSTEKYITQGKLTNLAPNEGGGLHTTSSEAFNEIICNGQLLAYRKEADMYIYQNQGKLYWIAGENFEFEEDGRTTIYFRLGTTREDMLPEKRIEKGSDYDDRGFTFEKKELAIDEIYPYRIVSCDIPTEYPITCCWTGRYEDSNWIWREYFNVDIREIITQ